MKPRLSIPLALLVVLSFASIAFFVCFGQNLPPVMALRFDLGGHPTVWVDRIRFIVVSSFLSFMLPTFIVACVGVLPRMLPDSLLHVPNKAYWLAPERRNAAFDLLMWLGLWLGCLVEALLIAVNVAIERANAVTPPSLSAPAAAAPIAVFAAAMILWGLAVRRAFAVPPSC